MKYFVILVLLLTILVNPAGVLAAGATLSLSPSSGTFNKGCAFSLEVKLDTGGSQTDGTDAVLFYDASRFNATSINSGTIYGDFPGNNIDSGSGRITISGLAAVSSAFTGAGTLATINFTVKDDAPTGVTQVKFDFDPNDKTKTTDSNVVERGTIADVLSSVVNGNYTIGTGNCTVAGAPVSALPSTGIGQGSISTPSAEIPMKKTPVQTLPPAGSEQLTFTVVILGVAMTILGILGLA